MVPWTDLNDASFQSRTKEKTVLVPKMQDAKDFAVQKQSRMITQRENIQEKWRRDRAGESKSCSPPLHQAAFQVSLAFFVSLEFQQFRSKYLHSTFDSTRRPTFLPSLFFGLLRRLNIYHSQRDFSPLPPKASCKVPWHDISQ